MPRTKTYDREEVLEKALFLFQSQGYEATGMQALVSHMGISRSSIYEEFGDKEGLYFEALQHYRSKSSILFIKALNETTNPIATFRQFLIDGLKEQIKSGKPSCFMASSCTEVNLLSSAKGNELVMHNKKEVVNAMTAAIKRGQKNDLIKKNIKAKDAAEMIFAINNGAAVLSRIEKSPTAILKGIELAFQMLEK